MVVLLNPKWSESTPFMPKIIFSQLSFLTPTEYYTMGFVHRVAPFRFSQNEFLGGE